MLAKFRYWLGRLIMGDDDEVRVDRIIDRVEHLHLEPGDGILLTTDRSLSAANAADLKRCLEDYLKRMFGDTHAHPVLILTDGLRMNVISAAKVPTPATGDTPS